MSIRWLKAGAVNGLLVVIVGLGVACAPSAPATPGAGNPDRGRQLVATRASPPCGTCHMIPGIPDATGTVGPSLAGIGSRAQERAQATGRDITAEQYLRESIENPNAYIVPGFPSPSPMPSYAGQFSGQDLNDIVAFLMTLK